MNEEEKAWMRVTVYALTIVLICVSEFVSCSRHQSDEQRLLCEHPGVSCTHAVMP